MPHRFKELEKVRQIPGEPRRRWFASEQFDLIVWFDAGELIRGFELCYDKTRKEQSFSWRQDSGYLHMAVDDGENRPGRHKAIPVLVANGAFDPVPVYLELKGMRAQLPPEIANFVLEKIRSYRP